MRDEEFWKVERDFGGGTPMSLDRMRESAGGVIGRTWISSPSEIDMARALGHVLDLLADVRGEARRPPGPS